VKPTDNKPDLVLIPGGLYRVKQIHGVLRRTAVLRDLSGWAKPEYHYIGPSELFMITRVDGATGGHRFVEILWKDDLWICPKRVLKEALT